MKDATALERTIEGIAPSGFTVSVVPIGTASASPYAQERLAVAQAIPRRQAEFYAGRSAARLALAKLDIPSGPVPVGISRAPQWPQDIVGAITHAGEFAAAVVGPGHLGGIGIDLEENGRVTQDLAERIGAKSGDNDPGSQAALAHQGLCSYTTLFAAKEAGFKAYFPATQHFLGFEDVSCDFHPATQSFVLTLLKPDAPDAYGQRRIQGAFARFGNQVVTLAWISQTG